MAWVLKVAAQAAARGEEMAKSSFSHTSGTGGKSRAGWNRAMLSAFQRADFLQILGEASRANLLLT